MSQKEQTYGPPHLMAPSRILGNFKQQIENQYRTRADDRYVHEAYELGNFLRTIGFRMWAEHRLQQLAALNSEVIYHANRVKDVARYVEAISAQMALIRMMLDEAGLEEPHPTLRESEAEGELDQDGDEVPTWVKPFVEPETP